MKKFLVIIFILNIYPALSQEYDWVNFFRGGAVRINDIKVNNNSHFLVGVFSSMRIEDQSYVAKGMADIFILKVNNNGAVQSVLTVGGKGLESPVDLEFDESNNYIFGGIYRWGATFGEVSLGNVQSYESNAYVAKYDSLGNFLWVVDLRTNDDLEQELYDVEVDKEGNTIALSATQFENTYVSKISPNGTVLWETRYDFETTGKLSITDESITVVGSSQEGVNSVREFDSNGNEILTSRVLPITGKIRDIVFNEEGFIVGIRQEENSVYEETLGKEAGNFVFKIDNEFNFEWGMRIGESENYQYAYLSKLSPLPNQKTAISGRLSGLSSYNIKIGDLSIDTDSTSAFLGIIDSLGTVEWLSSFGNSGSSIQELSIDTESDGSIYFGNEMLNKAYFDCIESPENSAIYFGKIEIDKKINVKVDSKVCLGDTIHIIVEKEASLIDFEIQLGEAINQEELTENTAGGYVIAGNSGRGLIKVIGTYSNECGNSYQVLTSRFVEIIPSIKNDIQINGVENICLNEEISYTTLFDSDYTFEWTIPSELQVIYSSRDSIVVKTNDPQFESGEIALSITSSCESITLTKKVSLVNEPITDALTPIMTSLPCRSESISLTTTTIPEASSYQWIIEYKDLAQTQVIETSSPEVDITPLKSDSYSEIITVSVRGLNNCDVGIDGNELILELINNQNDDGEIVSSESICRGSSSSFYLEGSRYPKHQWIFRDDSGILADPTISNNEITFSADNDFILEVYGINECGRTLIDQSQIQVVDEAEPFIFEDCQKLFVEKNYKAEWFLNGDLISSTNSVLKQKSGRYLLRVDGICDQVEIGYDVKTANDYFVPNVFTPNGDGLNDTFMVSEELLGTPLKVINRAGDIVFQSNSYQNNWGQNKTISPGVYFYVIVSECQLLKGHVTVIR